MVGGDWVFPIHKNVLFLYHSIAEIRNALDKNESIDVLQRLCSNGVPSEVRGEVWRSVLGVKRRPDAIGTWEGPLDYENQTLIHKQCQEQAGKSMNGLLTLCLIGTKLLLIRCL